MEILSEMYLWTSPCYVLKIICILSPDLDLISGSGLWIQTEFALVVVCSFRMLLLTEYFIVLFLFYYIGSFIYFSQS